MDAALQYWCKTGFNSALLTQAYDSSPAHQHLVKVAFHQHSHLELLVKNDADKQGVIGGRLQAAGAFFHALFSRFPGLNGDILLTLADGVYPPNYTIPQADEAPLFTYCKLQTDQRSLLLPDAHFMATAGYAEMLRLFDEIVANLTWERKDPRLFWRGSTTGYGMTRELWHENPRIRLSLLAQSVNNPQLLDTFVSEIVQCKDTTVRDQISEAGILRPRVSFLDFIQFRYLLDIDGNCSSWSLFPKLAMNCVIFKVESPFTQWFYPMLHPWEHFIPVSADLADLLDKLEWARANDDVCQRIAHNARLQILSLSFNKTVDDSASLLSAVCQCHC